MMKALLILAAFWLILILLFCIVWAGLIRAAYRAHADEQKDLSVPERKKAA